MKRIRVLKDKNFTTINNEFIFNKNMSLKAKGLLCHLLALPNDWELYVEEVEKWHKEGKKAIYSAFKELIDLGYVERNQKREKGKIVKWDYTVYEKPHCQKVDVEKVDVQNAPLLNTNNKLNTNKSKTKGFDYESIDGLNVDLWKKWKEFRSEQFRTSYKPIGEKAAIGKIMRISNGSMEIQEQIIQQSIENGWKGLFELKQEKQSKTKSALDNWQKARNMINNG